MNYLRRTLLSRRTAILLPLGAIIFLFSSCEKEPIAKSEVRQVDENFGTNSTNFFFAPLSSSLRDDYKISFTLNYPGNYDYFWDFGDGTTKTTSTNSVTHQYICTRKDYNVEAYAKQKGTGVVVAGNGITVTAKHDGGGVQPLAFTSRIRDDYLFKFSAQGGAGCSGNRYYHWNFGDGTTRVTSNFDVMKQYPSVRRHYTVTLIVKDGAGNILSDPVSRTILSKRDS